MLTPEPSFFVSLWQIADVRRSSHTIALCKGCPTHVRRYEPIIPGVPILQYPSGKAVVQCIA